MSQFSELRQQITEQRKQFLELKHSATHLQQRQQILDFQIREKLRELGLVELPASDPLVLQKEQSQNLLTENKKLLAGKRQELNISQTAWQSLGKPEELLTELNDAIPILLLPIKIQTRFVRRKYVLRQPAVWQMPDISGISQLANWEDGKMENLLLPGEHFQFADPAFAPQQPTPQRAG